LRQFRLGEILLQGGLRWRKQETRFGPEKVDPDFAKKKATLERLYTEPPAGSVVLCLDEMGFESAQSYPGREPVRIVPGANPAAPGCRYPHKLAGCAT